MSNFEPGPGLLLVAARQRLTRAVLATLIGPTDPTQSYAGSGKAEADHAEVLAAARELVAAEEAWQADLRAKADRMAALPGWAAGYNAEGNPVP